MKIRTLTACIMTACAAGVGLSLPVTTFAQSKHGFYERKEEGWFWYQKEPEPVEEELEEIEPPILEVAMPEPEPEPEPTPQESSTPPVYSTAWLKEALPKYHLLAIDNPTVENVKAYLYLQRLAIDRAERYATASEMATVGDPFLDETIRRPIANFATGTVDAATGLATNQVIRDIAQRAGLFFFFSSECTLCELQAPLIKTLVQHEGFSLVPISTDNKNLVTNPFDNYQNNEGHAEMLGVQTLPALFLVTPDGKFSPIGQGAFSLSEIQQRLLIVARRENLISEAEYNKTRPIINHNNLADLIQPYSTRNNVFDEVTTTEDGVIPPAILLEHLSKTMSMSQGY